MASSGRPASALTSTSATSAELCCARALPPTSRRDALSAMETRHAGVGPATVPSAQSPSLERASASRGRSETSWSASILPRVSSRPRLGRLPLRRRHPRTLSSGAACGGPGSPAFTARQMVEKLTAPRPPRSRRHLPPVCSGDQRPSTLRLRTSAARAVSESLLRGLQALRRASERDWAAMAP